MEYIYAFAYITSIRIFTSMYVGKYKLVLELRVLSALLKKPEKKMK